MTASNRWNLSRDYYDVLPADSEMDAPDYSPEDTRECSWCGKIMDFCDCEEYDG